MIRRNMGYLPAINFLENIAASPRLVKIYSDSTLEKAAEKILRKYTDQDFSYTDAVSFAVMENNNIHNAFAFDSHFLTAGFTLVP